MLMKEIRSEPLPGPAQLALEDINSSLKSNQQPPHYLRAQNHTNPTETASEENLTGQ